MNSKSRTRVKTTPFSDFFRNAPSSEKRKFFDKVIQESVEYQRKMIAEAELLKFNK
ncbi:hypothetical protein [Catenovulum agarivorans]|uniref:hypothetical protein n=1 Tax=Catenovulum agarivorans TaxID=1172192 RepID=UPI00037B7A60|nr:hypothetical protein [Catenovulum agarivorans]